jgi:hypothetical protein
VSMRWNVQGAAVEIACDSPDLAELVARRLAAFPAGANQADVHIEPHEPRHK